MFKTKSSIFLLLLFTIVIMVGIAGCGGSKNSGLTPPSWIWGTWYNDDHSLGFQFTSNTGYQIIGPGPTKMNFELPGVKVTEITENDNIYEFQTNNNDIVITTYKFTKNSETEIAYNFGTNIILSKH